MSFNIISEIKPYDLFDFIQRRIDIKLKKEAGAAYPWSNDDILNRAKINNIYREDDRTTKFIFSKLDSLEKNPMLIWTNILTLRFTNRMSTIDAIFPIEVGCNPEVLISKLSAIKGPLMNTAYRIHPRVGKLPNRLVKDKIAYVHLKAFDTIDELMKGNSIDVTVMNLNKLFGGAAFFYLFQCVLDFSHYFPHIIDPMSRPFIGAGGRSVHKKLGIDVMDLTRNYNELFDSSMTPYNMENALCEFRKYVNIKSKGKITKRYKRPD